MWDGCQTPPPPGAHGRETRECGLAGRSRDGAKLFMQQAGGGSWEGRYDDAI